MSENLNQICCALIEEFYGEFHCALYSHLAYHGRTSAPQLAQRTHLPLRKVKAGLSTLIQCQMVYHHTDSEGLSTYQANTEAPCQLLRIGRLIELVRTDMGSLAAEVITEACWLGFATVAELESNMYSQLSNGQSSMTNGEDNTKSDAVSHHDVNSVIQRLLSKGYLHYVRAAHFQTSFDVRLDVEKYFISNGLVPSTKGKKGTLELNARIDSEMKDRIEPRPTEHGHVPDTLGLRKRSSEDTDDRIGSKRRKLEGETNKLHDSNQRSSDYSDAAKSVLVCVDFSSVVNIIKKQQLLERATRCLGGLYSQVLAAALLQVSHLKPTSTLTDSMLDLRQIQQEINHRNTKNLPNGHRQNGVEKTNGTRAYEDEENEDKMTYNEVDRALAQLADGGFNFLQGAYGCEWKISKDKLNLAVQQDEISRMMNDRLGSPALRIIRMLKSKGKLDEKALQEVGLLGAKDLRQTLAQLKQMGFIDLQEVPRESQRQPNRTIFLWFHDSNRVQKVLLDGLYKAMVRLMQRLKLEREKLASTLEKVERSDVQGNEEQIMSAAELRVLRRWQKTEQWLLGEVTRLDESVALLRDL